MTEVKEPPVKRQRVEDETPVPVLSESKSELKRLPVDLLAEALSFLSVFEVAKATPKLTGSDFPEAVRRATKRITTLKFDSEWNQVLADPTARGLYAANIGYKYSRDKVKTIIVGTACPNAMIEKFMRRITSTFPGVVNVIVERYIPGADSRGALMHLLQLPHLRRLELVWGVRDTPDDFKALETIRSTELTVLRVGCFDHQLVSIQAEVLQGISTLLCYVKDSQTLAALLQKTPALTSLAIFPQTECKDVGALFSAVVRNCASLSSFAFYPNHNTDVSMTAARILFGMKKIVWLHLAQDKCRYPSDRWVQWWTEATKAWPSLETIQCNIPGPTNWFALTRDAWPTLRQFSTTVYHTVDGSGAVEWSQRHPLFRLTSMKAMWYLGQHKVDAKVLHLLYPPGRIHMVLHPWRPTLAPLAALLHADMTATTFAVVAAIPEHKIGTAYGIELSPLFADVETKQTLPLTHFYLGVYQTGFVADKAFFDGVERCLECCPRLKLLQLQMGIPAETNVSMGPFRRDPSKLDAMLAPTLRDVVFATTEHGRQVDGKFVVWCFRTASGCYVVHYHPLAST